MGQQPGAQVKQYDIDCVIIVSPLCCAFPSTCKNERSQNEMYDT